MKMKKNKIRTSYPYWMLWSVIGLLCVGCSNHDRDESPVETSSPAESSPMVTPPPQTERSDEQSPVISSVVPSGYRDEGSGEWVDFELRRQRAPGDSVLFRRYVTHWRLNPTVTQWALETEQRHLPYFVVTVEDPDTVAEERTLLYALSCNGDVPIDRDYREAERYSHGQPNQSVIILSQETVGTGLTTFVGLRECVLHLRARDAAHHETRGEVPFQIDNLRPSMRAYVDPEYMNPDSYIDPSTPSNYIRRVPFWSDNRHRHFRQMRRGVPFENAMMAYSRVIIENLSDAQMYVTAQFEGSVSYHFERTFQDWNAQDEFVSQVVNRQEWREAPVSYEIVEWRGPGHERRPTTESVPGLSQVFRIPPVQVAPPDAYISGITGQSGLVVLLLSAFNFRERSVMSSVNPDLVPNTHHDSLRTEGYLTIRTAPVGMPEAFYLDQANWDDLSHPVTQEVEIISSAFEAE